MSVQNRPDDRTRLATEHLLILRREHATLERQDRTYVRLAYTYGLTVPEIAEASGLTVERIQQILAGA